MGFVMIRGGLEGFVGRLRGGFKGLMEGNIGFVTIRGGLEGWIKGLVEVGLLEGVNVFVGGLVIGLVVELEG